MKENFEYNTSMERKQIPTKSGESIIFTIPDTGTRTGVPFKRRHRHTKSGFTYKANEDRTDEKIIVSSFLSQYIPDKILTVPISICVDVHRLPASSMSQKKKMDIYGEYDLRKPDLTNIVKQIEDALNCLIYKDDSQICEIFAAKTYSHETKVKVIITLLEDQE